MLVPGAISPSRLTAASHVLAAVALALVLQLHLLPALLAGLLVYSVVNALAPSLQRQLPGVRAHLFVVAALAALVVGILTALIALPRPSITHI